MKDSQDTLRKRGLIGYSSPLAELEDYADRMWSEIDRLRTALQDITELKPRVSVRDAQVIAERALARVFK